MLSRFLLVLKMSVLDIIRYTASFLSVSSVFGERKTRQGAILSRNGPWERLAQRTLGRVSEKNEVNQCLGSLPTL